LRCTLKIDHHFQVVLYDNVLHSCRFICRYDVVTVALNKIAEAHVVRSSMPRSIPDDMIEGIPTDVARIEILACKTHISIVWIQMMR